MKFLYLFFGFCFLTVSFPRTASAQIGTGESEKKAYAMLNDAWKEVEKKNFKRAFEVCDNAIRLYGNNEESGLVCEDFRCVVENEKKKIGCVQGRPNRKPSASLNELKKTLIDALEKADVETLTKALPCELWYGDLGVGEQSPNYGEPQNIAIKLALLRKDKKTGKVLKLKTSGTTELITEGYSDGLIRVFTLRPENDNSIWEVAMIDEKEKK